MVICAGPLRRQSGTDAAWAAEGLFYERPPGAQERLLDKGTARRAPGSRIAAENAGTLTPDELARIGDQMRSAQEQWQGKGIDGFGGATDIDITELFYAGERTESSVFLADRGWAVTLHKSSELYATYGLEPPIEGLSAFGDITYLTAILG